jgi:uncharacterized protein YfkK (UPF0435 family)
MGNIMWTDVDRRYLKQRLDKIEKMLVRMTQALLTAEEMQMASVQDLNDAVAELTTSVDAAVTAISSPSGIKPEELDAAVAGIKEQIKKLNDAVHAAQM